MIYVIAMIIVSFFIYGIYISDQESNIRKNDKLDHAQGVGRVVLVVGVIIVITLFLSMFK